MTALIAAASQSHGPPHVLIVGVVAIGVVGWLIYRAVTGRRRSDDESHSDRGPEP